MRRLRQRLTPERSDAGISLAELLVSMMVFSVLLAITGGFIVSASRASAVNQGIDASTRSAGTAMAELTRVLRAASEYKAPGVAVEQPAFVRAGRTSMTLYAYINMEAALEKPMRVDFTVTGGSLVETKWAGLPTASGSTVYTFPTVPTGSVTLTDRVVFSDPRSAAAFTYLDAARKVLAVDGNGFVLDPAAIAHVRVDLQVGSRAGATDATILTNTVALTNTGLTKGTP